MYYGILVSSARFHGKGSLTYTSEEKLTPGQVVEVTLRNQKTLGFVESEVTKPTMATKPIVRQLPFMIPSELVELFIWLKEYYPSPLGSLVDLLMPSGVMPAKVSPPTSSAFTLQKLSMPPLTTEQRQALKKIREKDAGSTLLHGDTGTGKTRIYIELASDCLRNDQSVVVLTPEIGLTEAVLNQFVELFGKERVVVTHSGMTPAQRRRVWQQITQSETPLIVIGPRSALFSPLKNVGLIVMDEAHDSAYKQEQAPHYLTSRVAAKLAHLHGARFIMGTATPLVEDYWLFSEKKLPIIRLTKPAIQSDFTVSTEVIDLRDKEAFTSSRWLSSVLVTAIGTAIKSRQQSLVFLNRRGSARLIMCTTCGWQAMCPHCDIGLTYHDDTYQVLCHNCGYTSSVPTSCPACQASELVFRIPGTKALEAELQRLFPDARVKRFDSDSRGADKLERQYKALHSGEVDILIGTQTITKGFDLPSLGVIGVIQADSSLQIPDFSASERTYQLLCQVSGRIGRGHGAGKLFVQTYHPDSPLVSWALSKDYQSFYQHELQQRQQFGFPPFQFLLKITLQRASRASVEQSLIKLGEKLAQHAALEVIGPAPCFIEKQAGGFNWQLIIKSQNRSQLISILKELPANARYDIDPLDLL